MAIDKHELIANLIKNGYSQEDAELFYQKNMAGDDRGLELPEVQAKVNNSSVVPGVPIGTIVVGPQRDDDGFVVGYEETYDVSETELVVVASGSLYNRFDPSDNTITHTTNISQKAFASIGEFTEMSTGLKLSRRKDENGTPVTFITEVDADGNKKEIELRFQKLAIIGLRPKGTNEFTFYTMYLKGTFGYQLGELTKKTTSYDTINLVVKRAQNGNVIYTVIDLDLSTIKTATIPDIITLAPIFEEKNTLLEEYIEKFNERMPDAPSTPTERP